MRPFALALLLSSVLWAPPVRLQAAEPALKTSESFARSREWLRLLHYRENLLGSGQTSEVDAPGFFLAPDGKADPEAELKADIEAFKDPSRLVGPLKRSAQCAFPVRYHILKRELGLKIDDVPCPAFSEFLGRFNAHSATLVFSSAYQSSPASMFGHTFLRINAKPPVNGKKLDLLDYGLGYAAVVPPQENSFVYAYLGVMGGYPGQFSMEPYYTKVREYIQGESRDLWEYDLALTEEETVRLVSHAWEIETNGGFYYYFATRNCSYQLLALLEAVRPDWSLTGHFIHVIPAETIKKVFAVPGAVTGVRFRPSLHKRLIQGFETLTSPEREAFRELLAHERAPDSVDAANVLDVAIEYLHYTKESKDGKLDPQDAATLQASLTRRSQMQAPVKLMAASLQAPLSESGRAIGEVDERQADTRPDLGHGPYRVGLSGGWMSSTSGASALGSGQSFLDLNLKFAYHDLLNDDRGYSPFSQIDFPSLTLRYRPEDRRLSIEQLLVASITSLTPLTVIDHKLSWHAQADYYAAKDYGCIDCHLLNVEGGVGATINLFSPHALLSGMAYGYFEGGESLSGSVRGGPKLEIAAIVNPLPPFKSRLALDLNSDLFQSFRSKVYARVQWDSSMSFGPNWETRASFIRFIHADGQANDSRDYGEAKLTLNRYF